ncbi:MAG: hypothetical protein WD154_05430 [Nitrosopumilaceae archaeon]
MGYKEAQLLYKKKYGKLAKSSWIAHVLSDNGKTSGPAHSRKGNYKYPCPDSERKNLEKILKELKMI